MELTDTQERLLALFKQGRYLKRPGLNHGETPIGDRSSWSQRDVEALVQAGRIAVEPEGDYARGAITVLRGDGSR